MSLVQFGGFLVHHVHVDILLTFFELHMATPRTAGQSPRQNRQNRPVCQMGASGKRTLSMSHLNQVEPEMALLDHKSGHHLPEGKHGLFCRCSWYFSVP